MHQPVDVRTLVSESVIDARLASGCNSVRAVQTHRGNVVHAVRLPDVLYLSHFGLQVLDQRLVPVEAIRNPLNLRFLQRILRRRAKLGFEPPYTSPFEVHDVDEDVCILSNMYSTNFCHFTEELLKVLILERGGFKPRYVYTHLPPFAFDYFAAMGLDRARLLQIPEEPAVFRSAYYTTAIDFSDLTPCPDIFFELRDRMCAAASGIRSRYGKRLWLDRGVNVADTTRGFVNPDEIQGCLDDFGFTRLDIGSLPLLEQIAAVRDAEVIAGPHGAAFTHAIYMKPRSNVIEVFSPLYLNLCWGEICRALTLRYAMLAHSHTKDCPYQFGRQVYVSPRQLRIAFQSLD
jgi:hypothetical protein